MRPVLVDDSLCRPDKKERERARAFRKDVPRALLSAISALYDATGLPDYSRHPISMVMNATQYIKNCRETMRLQDEKIRKVREAVR